MTWFANKPALLILFPFLCGIALARYFELPQNYLWLASLILVLCCVLFFLCALNRLFTATALFALALVGAISYQSRVSLPSNHIREFTDLPCLVSIEGTVIRPIEINEGRTSTLISVDSVWVQETAWAGTGTCLLQVYETMTLAYGDTIVARGQLRLPAGQRNPGGFDYKKYLAAQNIHAVFRVASASHALVLGSGGSNPFYSRLILPLREFVLIFIRSNFHGQQAALMQALLLGMRGDLDESMREAFANVGVFHVLAVSGMHVGFITVVLIGLFGFIRISNPWKLVLVIAGLIIYAHLTGLKPSVVRATVMAIVILLGTLLQRRAHILNTLSIAALIILAANPLQLFEPGFQLSFLAVAGIALIYNQLHYIFRHSFYRWRETSKSGRIWLVNLFLVSLAAQLATLPLTMFYFGRIPIASLILNLVVIPLVAAIFSLGCIALCFSAFIPFLGNILAQTIWLLVHLLFLSVAFAERVPLSYLRVPQFPLEWYLIYLALLMLFVFWQITTTRKLFLILFLVLINVAVWRQVVFHRPGLKVTFFDVGQGDAALFEFPNGRTMLVDAGDCSEYFDCGKQVILPYLRKNGISQVDALVLTHPHADHIGGAPTLLETIPTSRIVAPYVEYESAFTQQIDSLRTFYHIPLQHVVRGDTLLIDPDVLIFVLHPTPFFSEHVSRNPAELNNVSIVLKCVYHKHSILMAGDAEVAAEESMLHLRECLPSTVLKLGHHGSDTASGPQFRDAVQPEVAVVSVATFNRFGLPSDTLLTAFEVQGTRVLRTDHNGAVQFICTPRNRLRIR